MRRRWPSSSCSCRRSAGTTTRCATSSRSATSDAERQRCPSRVHAIVLVSKMHKPTLRALAYARATRPSILEARHRRRRPGRRPRRCRPSGTGASIPVPLKVLDSPYREITRPVLDYVRVDPPGQPARPRRGLHPGVRRRALVGAAAAQPERAAAQGPAAVHAGRHGGLGAVAARRPREGAEDAARGGPVAAATGASGGRRADWRALTGDRPSRSATDVEVEVGPVAHGGHCVARHEGRVLFVRHTLPGERVRARVTERGAGDRFLRADAVEVLAAVARPGRVRRARSPARGVRRLRLAARRACRASARSRPRSCASSCARLAGLDRRRRRSRRLPATTERDGLGWRTRVRVRGRRRRAGRAAPAPLARRRRRSSHCRHRGDRGARPAPAAAGRRPAGRGRRAVRRRPPLVRRSTARRPAAPRPLDVVPVAARRSRCAAARAARQVGSASSRVAARGFWQVHPGAADAAGRRGAGRCSAPRPGERPARPVLRASGCSPAPLADAVGAGRAGRCRRGRRARRPGRPAQPARPAAASAARAGRRRAGALAARTPAPRGARRPVVLDPPRAGAGADVVRAHRRLRRRGRSPTSRATRRRWPATSATFARARASSWRGCGLRPVPDDAPRRVRRTARAGWLAARADILMSR